ncbi:unnamed protein product [Cuscuta europaea]|uniref:Aminotransferase-like plant mobile domain-containing protein n=1 Tax=Cuscuta europaea TaxID=41803 RepID=A0A9P1EFX7_CUSEU|nr:unnamed protein product [Cuscuta europaea]
MADRTPRPGPVDRSVLTLPPYTHRAERVWHDPSFNDILKCINCPRDAYDAGGQRNPRVLVLIRDAGFLGVERIGNMRLDHFLITSLVERWRPETHTFHLPFGEVGISLQDVAILLGLSIDGMPLSGPTANTNAAWIHMCTELAGFTPHESDLERGVEIKCRAITCTPIRPESTEEEVTQHARVVVWQLLGGLLFPNTSGDKIRLYFLEILNGDLADARRWSWGSAVLGFLYHYLCKGSKWNARQIGGCLHLLQLWAWERLPMLRPQLLRPINLGHLPYGCSLYGPPIHWVISLKTSEINPGFGLPRLCSFFAIMRRGITPIGFVDTSLPFRESRNPLSKVHAITLLAPALAQLP